VLADPHRPGHELAYHPGETNVRMAQVVVINKVDTARPEDVATVRANVARVNPRAVIVEAASPLEVDRPDLLAGRRALVIEDGPTLTHGEMAYGAGVLAARAHGATLVDPRPYAVGSIREVFTRYPHLGAVLPAMGYSPVQIRELEQTIAAADCEVVVIGTPVDLRRVIALSRPAVRVRYELRELTRPTLQDILTGWVHSRVRAGGK
jgi:predicted GTPase